MDCSECGRIGRKCVYVVERLVLRWIRWKLTRRFLAERGVDLQWELGRALGIEFGQRIQFGIEFGQRIRS